MESNIEDALNVLQGHASSNVNRYRELSTSSNNAAVNTSKCTKPPMTASNKPLVGRDIYRLQPEVVYPCGWTTLTQPKPVIALLSCLLCLETFCFHWLLL